MIPYTEIPGSTFMNDLLSGKIKKIGDAWFLTEWHVAYCQQGCATADNFVTREDAETCWETRLKSLRESWGKNGAKFTETHEERPNGGKSIRFRSLLKNGKLGKTTGILFMDKINRK